MAAGSPPKRTRPGWKIIIQTDMGWGLAALCPFTELAPTCAFSKTYMGIVGTGAAQAPTAAFHKFVVVRPCRWSRNGDRGCSPTWANQPDRLGRRGRSVAPNACFNSPSAPSPPPPPPAASELVRALPCRSLRARPRWGSPRRAAIRARGCRETWRGCWSSSPRCHPSSSGVRPRSHLLPRW